MPDPGVTGQAIHFFFSVKPYDRRHQCRMALKALQLCDFLIKSSNTQGFREVPCRKSQTVVPPARKKPKPIKLEKKINSWI